MTYTDAIAITDRAEADAWIEAAVDDLIAKGAIQDRATLGRLQRANVVYWAAYYDATTAEQVSKAFGMSREESLLLAGSR